MAGHQQAQRPAVGPARKTDPGIAGAVLEHLRPAAEQFDQPARVLHLVRRRVQGDLAGRTAEAAGAVGQDDVAVLGQIAGVAGFVLLGPAEAVGQHHRRHPASDGRQEQRGVQPDRAPVGTRPGRNIEHLGAHRRRHPE